MSKLSERRARVSGAIDGAFASLTRVIPMLSGGRFVVGIPDPEKPHFDASGAVIKTTAHARREGQGARGASSLDHRGGSYRVSYAENAFGESDPPKKGDRIVLLEEPGSPELQVSHIEPSETAHGRLIVHLAKV